MIDGDDIAKLSDAERTRMRREKIGFVFQKFNLLPTLDARSNIDMAQARIGGDPLWLAGALRKIQEAVKSTPNEDAQASPGAAHLFIVNPLTGRTFDQLFTTHPDTDNRIARLEQLAQEWQQVPGERPPPLDYDPDRSEPMPPRSTTTSNRGTSGNDTPGHGPWG